MLEREAHEKLPEEHPERHEHGDIRFRTIAIIVAVFAGLGVIIHVGLYFLFGVYEATVSPEEMRRVGSSVIVERTVPPEPRLQGVQGFHENTPHEDLEEMLREHMRQLRTYGKTAEEGFVRVPIERALELLVERSEPGADQNPEEPR